ncbi:MAG: hypothetical protein GX793_05640 [Bacteroidales bacterium]|nr:DUF6252 family protein [Bacteroidales bacterium]MCK9498689.1 DUF6252 family protein [Bacteroidales bacterium]MDY0314019.1 DUF6252 family protein [Bacteroidales bacterium]NLB86524.1 hypothetical protein [Bacteroidales bacterium]
MKRILLLSFILIILIFTYSCKTNGGDTTTKPSMFCLVNSINWRSPEPKAVLSENSIKIYGTSANGQTIILNVGSDKVGEYSTNELTGTYAEFIPNTSSSSSKYSTSDNENAYGNIKVSSINEEAKTMSGSFSFKAYRNTDNSFKTISEGVFSNIPYQFYSLSDSTVFQNIFVYNDGERQWNAKDITAQKNDTALIIFADCDRNEAWQSITIWMPPTISAGVHYITEEGPVYAKFQKGFYTFNAKNGSITIVENNSTTKKIRGSFFFNYINENQENIAISDGQFEVKFTENN